MQAPERFETERLTAKRLHADHLEELCAMHRDARVMATLGGVRGDADTAVMLRMELAHWDRHGHGLWMFTDRATGAFVGRAGLRHVHVGGGDEVELSYALRAEAWGRGFATEMGRALLPIAFEQLRLPDLVAFTLPTNRASRRVIEKLGFAYERDIVHKDLPHVLYRLTSTE